MADNPAQVVTVIVPAYNVAGTIHETLLSVRSQTHTALEIIVVDDGSKDHTRQVVERHAADDPRIRLLHQANAGVASARNTALAEATGAYLAPIDADDLWRPDKIARQLALMLERGPGVELVYTWFAEIDDESRVRKIVMPCEEGRVLAALCHGNFVGHASSPLMRTDGMRQVGGYDTSLRASAAQGCEDWQLYLRLAEFGEFAVIKLPLTGYRITEKSMSSDISQMLRSYRLVLSRVQVAHPEYAEDLRRGLQGITKYFLKRSFEAARYRAALIELVRSSRMDPQLGLDMLSYVTQKMRTLRVGGVAQPGARSVAAAERPYFLDGRIESVRAASSSSRFPSGTGLGELRVAKQL